MVTACVRDSVVRRAGERRRRIAHGRGHCQPGGNEVGRHVGTGECAVGVSDRIARGQGAGTDAGRCAGGRCRAVVGFRTRERDRDRAGGDGQSEVCGGR